MPELQELLVGLVDGLTKAVDDSERRHLLSHVKALEGVAKDGPTVADLEKALAEGWLPDYYAGTDAEITASLAVNAHRERKTEVGGGVKFGPLTISGSLSETFTQATQTNVQVTVGMRRTARSGGVAKALDALGARG